ncbi:MAG: cell division protein FtsL [Gammaproteobacteria bacterium]|nr:cell division protein FtsL [Gammaproteobacteria bacterium]
MNARILAVWFLGLVTFLTALAVVLAKHESRKMFVELQGLERSRDELNVEWGRLQLEQGTWATHSRIESVARSKLGMEIPRADAIVLVKK